MAKKKLDSVYKVKTSLEELEVIANLKGTVEWGVAKRWMNRYIDSLRRTSLNLPADANLVSRHSHLKGQLSGLRTFVRYVEKASKKLEVMEKDGE